MGALVYTTRHAAIHKRIYGTAIKRWMRWSHSFYIGLHPSIRWLRNYGKCIHIFATTMPEAWNSAHAPGRTPSTNFIITIIILIIKMKGRTNILMCCCCCYCTQSEPCVTLPCTASTDRIYNNGYCVAGSPCAPTNTHNRFGIIFYVNWSH